MTRAHFTGGTPCAAECGGTTRRGGLCALCRQYVTHVRTALRAAVNDPADLAALYRGAKRLAAELDVDGRRLRAAAELVAWRDTLRNELAALGSDVLASPELACDEVAGLAPGRPCIRAFFVAVRRALEHPAFGVAVRAGLAGSDQPRVRNGRAEGGPLPVSAVFVLSGVWGRVWRFTPAQRAAGVPAKPGPPLLAARFPLGRVK